MRAADDSRPPSSVKGATRRCAMGPWPTLDPGHRPWLTTRTPPRAGSKGGKAVTQGSILPTMLCLHSTRPSYWGGLHGRPDR